MEFTAQELERLTSLLAEAEPDSDGDDACAAPPLAPGWTIQDFLDAPLSKIDEIASVRGISALPDTEELKELVRSIAKRRRAAPARLNQVDDNVQAAVEQPLAIIKAPLQPAGLIEALLGDLEINQCVALFGSAGCGKSYFLKELFGADVRVRDRYASIMFVDCRALGMRDPSYLAREMIWAQFGLDDQGFLAFGESIDLFEGGIEGKQRAAESDPIYAYLAHRFGDRGGLVILDHADELHANGAVSNFLSKSLMPAISKLGLDAIVAQRARPAGGRLKDLHIAGMREFPRYQSSEIKDWLKRIGSRLNRNFSFSVEDVETLVGARPELLDSLRAFLQNARFDDQATINSFVAHRLRFGHIGDCGRFVRAARLSPEFFGGLISSGGRLTNEVVSLASESLRTQLVQSGAVRQAIDDSIEYESRLIEARMLELMKPDAVATLLVRGSEPQILSEGGWSYLRRYRELAADGIAKSIASEAEPAVALRRFQSFLLRLEMESELYVRDPVNSRLWAPFKKIDALAPFKPLMAPEFARAIQNGCSVKCEDGKWLVPVRGNSGLVAMVIRVKFKSAKSEWVEVANVQALECLVEGVRLTLAQVLHRLAFAFERQLMAKTANMSREEMRGHSNLLQSFGCAGWAVLEKTPHEGWYTSRIEATGPARQSSPLMHMFAEVDDAELDALSAHRTGRGVVLSGDDLHSAFPHLPRATDAVFVQPISTAGDHCQLVVFVFDLSRQGVPITGFTQQRLRALARNLAA